MSESSLAELLERIRLGDRVSEAELLHRYEPFLRMIIRRQMSSALRVKVDSVDIFQSVMSNIFMSIRKARLIIEDADEFRAFLVRSARNRLIDHVRKNRRAISAQRYTKLENAEENDPNPSECLQADDTWRELMTICSDSHRPIIEMKREGFSLDEISDRTGMHKSSIRRILYNLARKLDEKRAAAE